MNRPMLLLAALLASCSDDKNNLIVYNTPPAATITLPPDGSTYDEGTPVEFYGIVDDSQQPPETLSVSWTSDIDGLLGEAPATTTGDVELVTASLSPGNHVITLQVIDDDATSSTDWLSIVINDLEDLPTLLVRSPQNGDEGIEEETVSFEVLVEDEQDAPTDLLVFIEDASYGEICSGYADDTGLFACDTVLPPGDYDLIFSVTDTEDFVAEAVLYFPVIALTAIDDDGDGYSEEEGDCDDTNSAIYPGAEEYYNDIDDDCDDIIDEDTVASDDDGDGQTELEGDCDDSNDSIYEGATEVCDEQDNDCDGAIDEGTSCVDDDGDGYSEIDGDCDDSSTATYPGAPEAEDGEDNDCDGIIDEGTNAYDDDSDGYSENDGDCDDANGDISPDATEVCDDEDNDCDGTTDEDDAADASTWYADTDSDSYGDADSSTVACDPPSGYVSDSTDCDDGASKSNPAASEICDNEDNDCDGTTDEGVTTTYYGDGDGDGYGDAGDTVAACSLPSGVRILFSSSA